MDIDLHKQKKFLGEFLIDIILGLIGMVFVFVGALSNNETFGTIFLSIGTSIIASVIISVLNLKRLYHQEEIRRMMEEWGIEKIYEHRAEINTETNKILYKAHSLDIIAMGLKGFRDSQSNIIKKRIMQGMKLRILTPDPTSKYLESVDIKEDHIAGSTKTTIESLIAWTTSLKQHQLYEGQIVLKTYDNYPYDFYFNIDGLVFVGPYEDKSSQQTITYKFNHKGKGSEYYKNRFETLWEKYDK